MAARPGPAGRAVLVTVVPAAVVASMWLTWVRSGSGSRNSFEMFRTAQRLGLEGLTPFRLVWFLLPVICSLGVALALLGRIRAAALLFVIGGAIAVATGVAVVGSDQRAGSGVPAAICAGGLQIGLGIWLRSDARRESTAGTG